MVNKRHTQLEQHFIHLHKITISLYSTSLPSNKPNWKQFALRKILIPHKNKYVAHMRVLGCEIKHRNKHATSDTENLFEYETAQSSLCGHTRHCSRICTTLDDDYDAQKNKKTKRRNLKQTARGEATDHPDPLPQGVCRMPQNA